MKKSVLSIVAIAFAAVSVFTSCDKNDDGYGQSAKTETVASNSSTTTPSVSPTMASTAKLSLNAFAINKGLANLGTWTVTITDGDKTAEYDIVAQGKLGSYYTENGLTCNGYVLAISQPYSESIKATVKFTPNDNAKSLTYKDEINGSFGVCHTEVTDPNAQIKFVGLGCNSINGHHIIESCETIAKLMSK